MMRCNLQPDQSTATPASWMYPSRIVYRHCYMNPVSISIFCQYFPSYFGFRVSTTLLSPYILSSLVPRAFFMRVDACRA